MLLIFHFSNTIENSSFQMNYFQTTIFSTENTMEVLFFMITPTRQKHPSQLVTTRHRVMDSSNLGTFKLTPHPSGLGYSPALGLSAWCPCQPSSPVTFSPHCWLLQASGHKNHWCWPQNLCFPPYLARSHLLPWEGPHWSSEMEFHLFGPKD